MENLIIDDELKDVVKTHADEIRETFNSMADMLDAFDKRYKEVLDLTMSTEKCKKAKRLRLDIRSVRTAAEAERKKRKAEYIDAGRAIDGVFNILKNAVSKKEAKLQECEDYYDNLEKQRVESIKKDREQQLLPFNADTSFIDLGNMPDEVWQTYLAGAKASYEQAEEAKKQAVEQQKIQEEKENIFHFRKDQVKAISEYIPFGSITIDTTEEEFLKIVNNAEKTKNEAAKIKAQNQKLKEENEITSKKLVESEEARERIEFEKMVDKGVSKKTMRISPFRSPEKADKMVLKNYIGLMQAEIKNLTSARAKDVFTLCVDNMKEVVNEL